MILFMKLKGLHGHVMVKNEIDNMDINSYSTWDRNMCLPPCIDTENCQT